MEDVPALQAARSCNCNSAGIAVAIEAEAPDRVRITVESFILDRDFVIIYYKSKQENREQCSRERNSPS